MGTLVHWEVFLKLTHQIYCGSLHHARFCYQFLVLLFQLVARDKFVSEIYKECKFIYGTHQTLIFYPMCNLHHPTAGQIKLNHKNLLHFQMWCCVLWFFLIKIFIKYRRFLIIGDKLFYQSHRYLYAQCLEECEWNILTLYRRYQLSRK